MADFFYQPLFELGPDETPYRRLDVEGVSPLTLDGQEFLEVEPSVLRELSRQAFDDIAHLLRPGHLAQLRKVVDDPESSANDRFVAMELLRNANIAAGRVLPGCQDTGTAIVMGHKGERVLTGGTDAEALSHGVFDAYQERNLRYSQMAPLDMYTEKNTASNLPAQIDISSEPGDEYELLFIAKGGGSANKTFLYQETKALLNPTSLVRFIETNLKTIGTSACPPYHLALVIGGLSAEFTMKTVKLASTRYLDRLPTTGNEHGRAFRDLDMERQVLKIAEGIGVGAQFGGKYFAHDARVIRLPRHGASCPVGLGVSCSADRQALAKITREGVFLEQLEENPAKYLPEVTDADLDGEVVQVDLNRPMPEILAQLSQYPVATRLSLSGTMVVARDIAHAKLKERLDAGQGPPRLCAEPPHLLRRSRQAAGGAALGVVRADDGRTDGLLRGTLPVPRREHGDAGQGEPVPAGDRGLREARRLLPRLDRRSGRPSGRPQHPQGRGAGVSRARDGGDLARGDRELPGLHRRRRQGQRLLREAHGDPAGAAVALAGGRPPRAARRAEPGAGRRAPARAERGFGAQPRQRKATQPAPLLREPAGYRRARRGARSPARGAGPPRGRSGGSGRSPVRGRRPSRRRCCASRRATAACGAARGVNRSTHRHAVSGSARCSPARDVPGGRAPSLATGETDMRMTKVMTLAAVALLAVGTAAEAQRALSTRGHTATQVGGSFNAEGRYEGGQWIDIHYGRPILRGRMGIFGEGDDYAQGIYAGAPLWRVGADQTTTFTTEADLIIGGERLPAGEYTMFADLANPEAWELIFSTWGVKQNFTDEDDDALWGAYGYTPERDVMRTTMSVTTTTTSQDQLIIGFRNMTQEDGGEMFFYWDNQLASVPVAPAE